MSLRRFTSTAALITHLKESVKADRKKLGDALKAVSKSLKVERAGLEEMLKLEAQINIHDEVLASLADAKTKKELVEGRIAFLLKAYIDKLVQDAKWSGNTSTSQTKNLARREQLSALAGMIELLQSFRPGASA